MHRTSARHVRHVPLEARPGRSLQVRRAVVWLELSYDDARCRAHLRDRPRMVPQVRPNLCQQVAPQVSSIRRPVAPRRRAPQNQQTSPLPLTRCRSRWLSNLPQAAPLLANSLDLRGRHRTSLLVKLYRRFRQRDELSPLVIEGLALETLAATCRLDRLARAQLINSC